MLAVGAQAPIAFVIAFIPMLFIAFAYRELNNAVPDCGTTFTWGTKAFGPWVGWLGGWGVAVAGMVVLANLAQIAGIYFWALIDGIVRNSEDALLAENVPLVTATGVVFIAAMTWVSWRGVEIGERIQNILLAIQYLALAIFVVAALWQFFAGTAPDPTPFDCRGSTRSRSRDWSGVHRGDPARPVHLLGLGHVPRAERGDQGPQAHPRSCRAADHRHPARHLRRRHRRRDDVRRPRREGTGLGNEANADDFFLAIKDGLLGPVGWVLVVAVMISAISSTQTTILPTARGTLAMAAYRALPEAVRDRAPAVQDAVVLDHRHGRSWRSSTTSA